MNTRRTYTLGISMLATWGCAAAPDTVVGDESDDGAVDIGGTEENVTRPSGRTMIGHSLSMGYAAGGAESEPGGDAMIGHSLSGSLGGGDAAAPREFVALDAGTGAPLAGTNFCMLYDEMPHCERAAADGTVAVSSWADGRQLMTVGHTGHIPAIVTFNSRGVIIGRWIRGRALHDEQRMELIYRAAGATFTSDASTVAVDVYGGALTPGELVLIADVGVVDVPSVFVPHSDGYGTLYLTGVPVGTVGVALGASESCAARTVSGWVDEVTGDLRTVTEAGSVSHAGVVACG